MHLSLLNLLPITFYWIFILKTHHSRWLPWQPIPLRTLLKATCLSLTALTLIACNTYVAPPHSSQGITSTLAMRLQTQGQKLGNPVFIRIFKEEKQLEVWMQAAADKPYTLLASYPICKYSGTLGPKQREGDHQAPEGFYAVGLRGLNPNSQYHRAFNLGFPNTYDQAQGYSGSYLMVHGACVSVGCYAMTDRQMTDIYQLVDAALKNGQPYFRVHAMPFKMTHERLAREKNNRWYPFWLQLQQGYLRFEQTHQPPVIDVVAGRYHIR